MFRSSKTKDDCNTQLVLHFQLSLCYLSKLSTPNNKHHKNDIVLLILQKLLLIITEFRVLKNSKQTAIEENTT